MDTDSPFALARFFLPKIPSLAWAGVQHSLWLSPTSTKWDLRTSMQVAVLRSLMTSGSSTPTAVGKIQNMTLTDKGAKGKLWAARVAIPKPAEEGARDVIVKAIEEMGTGEEVYTIPTAAGLRAEWIGRRSEARTNEDPLPDVSEEERYTRLMSDEARTSKTTVLYFHGGAYYLCGFGTHRVNVAQLAKTCKGRALLVEYRLAPQSAFPAQLIDGLNSYLWLMYPPEGAVHEPVPAKDIVFAGDSAGGNLAFALLQLLLQLHRTKGDKNVPTVMFNGKEVEVPLPAGLSTQSPWLDIARAQESMVTNAKYDYLPGANHDDSTSKFPTDHIWPTTPPRGDLFCDLTLLAHPLVSPVVAKDWTGSPPLYIMTGEELLTDEDLITATAAVKQGVTVEFEQYEAMPHCFAMVMPHIPTSKRCYQAMGDFCRRCVEGDVTTKGTWIAAKTGEERAIEVSTLISVTPEGALARIRDAQARRLMGYEREGKMMPKPAV